MFVSQMLNDARSLTPPPDNVEELVAQPISKTTLGMPLYRGSTAQQFKAVLDKIDVDECDADGENAFYNTCDGAENCHV